MHEYSAHVDTFARERLPPRDLWPDFRFDLPDLHYPERTNCARVLLDDALAEGCANRAAIYSDARTWTYGDLARETNRIANVLVHQMGVVPGNRVVLRARNAPMLVCAWLAVIKAGGIAVTTMPMLRARELAPVIEHAQIGHALCDASLVEELRLAASTTGRCNRIVSWGDGQLEALAAKQPDSFQTVDTAATDVCLLAFTSGTTGTPKGTMHFHRDVLAIADIVGRHLLRTDPEEIYVGSPPLGFTFGLGALLVFPLRFRAAVALVEQPSADALLSAVQQHRATCLFTAPTMYRQMLPLASNHDLSTLRRCVSAGEPLTEATSDAWRSATGIRLIDGIGATEMLHIFIGAADPATPVGATGKPLPGYEACVLDEHGRPLPRGHAGRLAVKGPTGCRYLNGVRQGEYVVNRWNVTGDIYHVDDEGYFWFQCRGDDLIVSSGYNIAGPEVEAALAAHPAVKECAVIGAPDMNRGQIVQAFVVLNAGATGDDSLTRRLQDFVKGSIAPYKYPRAIVYVTSLPKTPSGKLQRSALRDHVAHALSDGALRR